MDVSIQVINQAFLSVTTKSDAIKKKISKNFSYRPEGYKFSGRYIHGDWNGIEKVFIKSQDALPYGLYPELKEFCETNHYTLKNDTQAGTFESIDKIKLINFVKSLNITINNNPIILDDFRFMCQFNAIYKSLVNRRCILQAPTGIGKSLIIYCLVRYWQQHIKKANEKCIVIVPTIQLVDQMYSDFGNYSANDTWEHKDNIYKIYQGASREGIEEDIIISTYQSINKLPREWFAPFSMVIGDEAHKFTAKTLKQIMNNSTNAVYRIGTTGTAGEGKTNIMVLKGEFGKVFNISKTKRLQERKILSDLLINVVKLNYPLEVRKKFFHDNPKDVNKIKNFQNELNWLVENKERNNFIKSLAMKCPGNTLIMFQLVEKHGKVLYNLIKEEAECKVFYISGETKKEEREKIRALVETQKKSIIVASFGTFAEGINIKNLHNLILASPTKSETKILQSIGRVLRLAENGQRSKLYDLYDNLRTKKNQNTSLSHIRERMKYYKKQEFKIKTHEVIIV